MADELGSVSITVKVEIGQLESDLAKARAEIEKFDKSANKAATSGGKKLKESNKKVAQETSKLTDALEKTADSAAFLTGPLGGVSSRIGLMSSAFSAGAISILAASTAFAAIAVTMKAAIDEAEEWERSTLKTNAILKATGSSAGLTANQIEELTNQVKMNTLATESGAISAAQKLLTFRSVQGDTFRDAIKLSQDLAAVGFGSIDSAAVQLGKALEDPVNGLAALRRVGVSFSPVQKQMIADLMETGRVAEAQRIILDALAQQVGGAGEAEAGGLSGAYHRLSESIADFLENIGKNGPLQATTVAINALTSAIQFLNDALFETGESVDVLGTLGKALSFFGPAGSAAATGMSLFSASIRENSDAITQNLILEDEAQKRAAAKGRIAAENIESERKQGIAMEAAKKAQEAAAAAAKALNEQRAQTINGLSEEVRILETLSAQYLNSNMSAQQLATTGEILRTQSALQLQSASAEGQAIATLVTKRNELTAAMDAETKQREAADKAREDFTARIEGIQQQITDIGIETQALGMATQAGEQYRIEQELINAATKDFNTLTEDQINQIHQTAVEYANASAKLKDVQEQQRLAEEQAQRMADQQQRFQESLASGLTDALFGAKSAGDAFKSLAMEIGKAVIQAEILALIQAGTGVPTGKSSGGKGSAVIGALGAIAGMFTGGATSSGGAITSVMASQMHTGGTVGQDGKAVSVPAATFISAPRFHNGLKPDEFPAILQQGEEVVPKDQIGRRGGMTTINNWNIEAPDPNAFRASQRQINRAAAVRVQTR